MPGGALESEQELSGPSSVFVGQKLDEHRGAFVLEYPMDKGAVVDGGWDAMEKIWDVSTVEAAFEEISECCTTSTHATLPLSISSVHIFQSQRTN
jgi:actin-related protein